jgi:hypothetical protein
MNCQFNADTSSYIVVEETEYPGKTINLPEVIENFIT